MITRLDSIVQRRAALVQEIAAEREGMAALVDSLRTQFAVAGLGLLATRVLRRSRWFRVLTGAGAVIAAVLPFMARLAARLFHGRLAPEPAPGFRPQRGARAL